MPGLFPDLPIQHTPKRNDIALLHKLQCRVCPLAQINNLHPDMPASGAEDPLVYILGEAPGKDEDIEGKQFVGESGQLLRPNIPREFRNRVRFNNVVRTRPWKNETPSPTAIECCRPSIIKDIERSKPRAIFGFGNVPLTWVSGFSGITMWRGRRMPVRVGTHTCWYYPMLHPAFLLRQGREGKASISELQKFFILDLKKAWAEVEDLPAAQVHTPDDVFQDIECLYDPVRIENSLRWAAEQPDIGVDYETNMLRPYGPKARILTIAVANEERGIAFPLDHPEAEYTPRQRDMVAGSWKRFLLTAKGRKWVHSLAFELEWTGVHFGRELIRAGRWRDTSNQAAIIDERRGKQKPGPFSLEFLVQQYFGINLKKLTNVDRKKLASTPVEIVCLYNGGDARYHKHLGIAQAKVIKGLGLQEANRLAQRRVPTVVLSTIKGIPVRQEVVARLRKKYAKRIEIVTRKIFKLPQVKQFNAENKDRFVPLEPKNVIYVLNDIMKRKECRTVNKWTDKVEYSSEEDVLKKIGGKFCNLILRLRKSVKRKSTYIDPLFIGDEDCVVHADGLIHPIYNTYFAETGRLSAEDPNIQNVPKRDEEAKEVREQIAALLDYLIAAFDYGQIEYRVIGMFTKDKTLVKALWENFDVHGDWARRIAHRYPARIGGKKFLNDVKVMKDFRTDIKNQWTFPLFFGAKLESAAGYLKIPPENLTKEYDIFWQHFAGVKQWQEDVHRFYDKHGYVECLTGRRRHGPLSPNQIINSPVQGSAAEIVLDAMCRLSELDDWEYQPEINIHDDLTFVRAPEKRIDEFSEKIIDMMIDVPFEWAKVVPISVEMSYGKNWLNMEEVGTFFSHQWRK